MNGHTEHHILRGPDGQPLYVVIPWEEYEEKIEGRPDDEVFLPHEVVVSHVQEEKTMLRAWREYLGLTQRDVAGRMGVSQAAYAKMEAAGSKPRVSTLKKIAAAMGVEWEQLRA
jgi:DNA-binding XRE family transcriptional regulator